MKKNRMMRLASALLVLTLLTTSIISGTFAKYTTTGSASDTARVAKFGVVINTSGSLFSDAYVKASDNTPASAWSKSYTDKNITVATNTHGKENLVAPGTQSYGTGLTFGITGTPEVATQITGTIQAQDIYLKSGYDYAIMVPASVTKSDIETQAEFTNGSTSKKLFYADGNGTYYPVTKSEDSYTANGKAITASTDGSYSNLYLIENKVSVSINDYCPVQYTLTGNTTYNGKLKEKGANAIAKKLAEAINPATSTQTPTTANGLTTYTLDSGVYDANTDLGTKGPKLGGLKLTWQWAFSDTDDNKDKEDTILGDMMAAEEGSTTTYKVVAKASSAANYADVTYDSENHLVKLGDDEIEIASLRTEFNIELTVNQVD